MAYYKINYHADTREYQAVWMALNKYNIPNDLKMKILKDVKVKTVGTSAQRRQKFINYWHKRRGWA